MLDFEWGNPAAAAAAMMLFGEEAGQVDACQDRGGVFAHYGGGGGMVGDFFPQPLAAAAPGLFPACSPAAAGLGMGLNLGVRTYFSSAEAAGARHVAGRVCRRRTRTARCQAEGCGADLTHAKHYHRRHKVCEFHSKASIVIAAGLSQRFCQQCSRFHVLSEFDQGKRSCRKRLADHNRRRRKSQDLTTLTTAANSNNNTAAAVAENNERPNKEKLGLFTTSSGSGSNNNNNNNGPTSKPQLALVVCNPEGSSSVTDHVTASPQQPLMALGLGSGGGVVVSPAVTGLSASSSTGGTSPTSVSFLSHLGGFRWDEGEDAWKQH